MLLGTKGAAGASSEAQALRLGGPAGRPCSLLLMASGTLPCTLSGLTGQHRVWASSLNEQGRVWEVSGAQGTVARDTASSPYKDTRF